jgi:hypothetical protein
MKTLELRMSCVDPTAHVQGRILRKDTADGGSGEYEPVAGLDNLSLSHLKHQELSLPKGLYAFQFTIHDMGAKVELSLLDHASGKEIAKEEFTPALPVSHVFVLRFEV